MQDLFKGLMPKAGEPKSKTFISMVQSSEIDSVMREVSQMPLLKMAVVEQIGIETYS